MTETQRAALMAAEGAFRRYTHHHITKNDGEKAKANYALADMMAAALAEPEPVAAEREACAALCETLQAPDSCTGVERSLWDVATMACADAIRARGSQ